MMPGGPVQRYLAELRRSLPFPAPRLVDETREHLVEATAASLALGRSQEEAETEAVRDYGPIEDLVAAVLQDGSALMSPRAAIGIRALALTLCFPTLVFVAANAIELMAGNDGGVGVFGYFFDDWKAPMEALLVFGPLFALGLVIVTSLRISRDRGTSGLAATIEIRMSNWTLLVAVIALITALAVIGYGIAENYSTWRDFRTSNWHCTYVDDEQVCYQGGLPARLP